MRGWLRTLVNRVNESRELRRRERLQPLCDAQPSDKYGKLVRAWLELSAKDFKANIYMYWSAPNLSLGELFFWANHYDATSVFGFNVDGIRAPCGCPVHIRSQHPRNNGAMTQQLANLIANDRRIPVSYEKIEPEHLPVFAQYRRLIDHMVITGSDVCDLIPSRRHFYGDPLVC
jgi:hypothetical protein